MFCYLQLSTGGQPHNFQK